MKNFIQFLTYFRIIAGPIIFIFIVISKFYGVAFVLFMLASISDYWDGYLARKYQLVSMMGEVLDPIADKILVIFVIISLALELESIYIGAAGCLIFSRDLWIGALRDLNARTFNTTATNVTFLAKCKTTAQFIALTSYLYGLHIGSVFIIFLADFLLLLAVILSLKTGVDYSINTFAKKQEK
jgi:CDP-diacylglycerol--glycerol-3-phosphate 3-phosphatidyltransferase